MLGSAVLLGAEWEPVRVATGAGPSGAAAAGTKTIDFIELRGTIDPPSSRYLLRHIDQASRGGSHLIVVKLNTPGGLDISMREIVERMLSSKVPIVVWVSPSGARAASAGVFITYAAHVAVMAPGTSIGAAHPVNLGGKLDEVTSAKVTNDAAAYIRSIARQRGRNPDWAEKAVRESAALAAEEAARQG
ncbi:MAG: NfeD family protein, partial [Anaerolineales bacterium]